MDWHDTIAQSFPRPRDDEPASLRQDIADELADHLQTALARRLVTMADESSARTEVVDRFGNPQRIARQLWLEAMQEKIMSQRMSLAVVSLLSVVCLTAVGLLWRTVEHAQAATFELLEENRAANRALLERLAQFSSPAPAATPSKSLDWNPVKAHLVLGEKNGPPAEGFMVRLSQMQSRGGARQFETVAEESSGPDGLADLGLVSPGKYELCAMFRAGGFENFSTPLTVLPGSAQTVEIVCPPASAEKVGVVIRAEMPEDLRSQDLYLTAELLVGPRNFSGSLWRSGFNGAQASDAQVVIIFAPDGRVGMTYQGIINGPGSGDFIQMLPTDKTGQVLGSPEQNPLRLFLTDHYLKTIRICRPVFSNAASLSRTAPLAGGPAEASVRVMPVWLTLESEWHFLPETQRIYPGTFDYNIASRDLTMLPKFTAEIGQSNEWRIVVPEAFWDQARADLERAERKAREKLAAEPPGTF